jgi:hypothetical protein
MMNNTTARKISIIDPVAGFTERDVASKAVLNTDVQSLLQYKIRKRNVHDINTSRIELTTMKMEINQIKDDLCDIKRLLLQITNDKR